MKNLALIFILLISITHISSCKKKEDDPMPQISTQQLTLRISPKVGNDNLDLSSSFLTKTNDRFTISSFRYYMSHISLIKTDGTEEVLTDKVFLINPNQTDYNLGNVHVGTYSGIKFYVGLDSITNHSDPTSYFSPNPLVMQSPSIHWSWKSGYIFMMMEGSCDTTANNTDVQKFGKYSHGMFFHIGTDDLLKKVKVTNKSFTVVDDIDNVLNIHSDINQLFTGINLKTENASHTMGTMPLASKFATNIPSMFTIE